MKFARVRLIVIAVIFVTISIGLIAGTQVGTLCGFGWGSIAAICPLGAILSMISSKTIILQALICVVIAAVLVFLLGRAFCGWVCPVSLWNRIVDFFKPAKKREEEARQRLEDNQRIARQEIESSSSHDSHCSSCGLCSSKHPALDSRHAVLGGTVLASIVFGFPVFCLVCPVGLSFAVISILVGLFAFGDLNWSLLFAPFFLVLEVIVLRKWCTRFCPISGLMSLIGRFSKTGRPQIDNEKCLETSKGIPCSQCATVCKYDVNLRHPGFGELPVHDCARCMECVEACPAHAISIRMVNSAEDKFVVKGSGAEE